MILGFKNQLQKMGDKLKTKAEQKGDEERDMAPGTAYAHSENDLGAEGLAMNWFDGDITGEIPIPPKSTEPQPENPVEVVPLKQPVRHLPKFVKPLEDYFDQEQTRRMEERELQRKANLEKGI